MGQTQSDLHRQTEAHHVSVLSGGDVVNPSSQQHVGRCVEEAGDWQSESGRTLREESQVSRRGGESMPKSRQTCGWGCKAGLAAYSEALVLSWTSRSQFLGTPGKGDSSNL